MSACASDDGGGPPASAAASAGAVTPFHLAIAVTDLAAARHFYGEVLGCPEGRRAETWVDFDFYGHQLVIHQSAAAAGHRDAARNTVDGDAVPIPHFGVVLPLPRWREFADRLIARGVQFEIPPRTRFAGTAGEQGTLFLRDPCGNAIEIKGFADISAQLFAV